MSLFFLSLKNIKQLLKKMRNIFEDLPRLWAKNKKLIVSSVKFFLFVFILSVICMRIQQNVAFIDKVYNDICTAQVKMPPEVFSSFLVELFTYFTFMLLFFIFFHLVHICRIIFAFIIIIFIIITVLKFFTNIKSWALTDGVWLYCLETALVFLFFSFFFLEMSKFFGILFKK